MTPEERKAAEASDKWAHVASPAKNYQEDYELENGNYGCYCIKCKTEFVGYKGRVLCRECKPHD